MKVLERIKNLFSKHEAKKEKPPEPQPKAAPEGYEYVEATCSVCGLTDDTPENPMKKWGGSYFHRKCKRKQLHKARSLI